MKDCEAAGDSLFDQKTNKMKSAQQCNFTSGLLQRQIPA